MAASGAGKPSRSPAAVAPARNGWTPRKGLRYNTRDVIVRGPTLAAERSRVHGGPMPTPFPASRPPAPAAARDPGKYSPVDSSARHGRGRRTTPRRRSTGPPADSSAAHARPGPRVYEFGNRAALQKNPPTPVGTGNRHQSSARGLPRVHSAPPPSLSHR